jgi:hypothetical protein
VIADFLGDLIGAAFMSGGATSGWKWRAKIERQHGRVLGSLRVGLGEVPGLSARWRVFQMTPAKGSIAFDSTVLTVSAAYRRTEPLRWSDTIWTTEPSPAVFYLQTPAAQVELMIATEDVGWVGALLGSEPDADQA